MTQLIRVLIIEDKVNDAKLMIHELELAGFAPQWERVDTEDDFRACLALPHDVILADGRTPGLDAHRALDILRENGNSTPLIVVTGALSDERAVEYMKHGAVDYLLKDRLARLGQAVRQAIEIRNRTEENRYRCKDGSYKLLSWRSTSDVGSGLVYATARDMTEQRRAAQELQRTVDLLQAIADGTTDAVFVKDRQGKYLLFNKAAATLTGRKVDEVLGQDDTFLYGTEHSRKVMESDRLVMQSNCARIVEEELTADGETRTYHTMKAPLRDSEGRVAGMIGISRDITERKRMESTLRASEERYRSIVEQSPDMTFLVRDNRVSFINRAGVELLGASAAEQVLGRSPLEFCHLDDQPQIRGHMAHLLIGPRMAPIGESRIVTLEGNVIDVDVRAASYFSGDTLEIQVVCRDVTVRKRAEEVLKRHVRQAEFSAAIGLALSHVSTLPEMLQGCVEAMVSYLDADAALASRSVASTPSVLPLSSPLSAAALRINSKAN